MTKQEFFVITRSTFKEHGFRVVKNRFFFDLQDIYIAVGIETIYGEYVIAYNFSLKALHSKDEINDSNLFFGYDLIGLAMFFDSNGNHVLDYAKMEKSEYEEKLSEMIIRYIEPFKNDAYSYINEAEFIPGVTNNTNTFILNKRAAEFLATLKN